MSKQTPEKEYMNNVRGKFLRHTSGKNPLPQDWYNKGAEAIKYLQSIKGSGFKELMDSRFNYGLYKKDGKPMEDWISDLEFYVSDLKDQNDLPLDDPTKPVVSLSDSELMDDIEEISFEDEESSIQTSDDSPGLTIPDEPDIKPPGLKRTPKIDAMVNLKVSSSIHDQIVDLSKRYNLKVAMVTDLVFKSGIPYTESKLVEIDRIVNPDRYRSDSTYTHED